MDIIRPGEIYWHEPDATVGREQGGRHPIIVVSGPAYNASADTLALAVPVTTVDRHWANHVYVSSGLPQDSWAMTEQVRCVSRERLFGRIGSVSPAELAEIRRWVIRHLIL